MKKILFALFFPAIAFAQNTYTVSGNIKGLKDSTLVFINRGIDGKTIAQTYASKGSFTLTGKLDAADFYQLGFIGYKETVELFMYNEKLLSAENRSILKKLRQQVLY